MTRFSVIKLLVSFAAISWASLAVGQDLHVSPMKNGIGITVSAQKPYTLMAGGHETTPTLTMECLHKGKNAVHVLMFSPGGAVTEDNPEASSKNGIGLFMSMGGGAKELTTWIPYNDVDTYAYYGKTEPERVQFIQTLMRFDTASIEFKPFLTGVSITSSFDLVKLREEMAKRPECAIP
jgi:hypothetical protein